jgi:GntR family transcriptional regulator, carbon starvation induced regulator
VLTSILQTLFDQAERYIALSVANRTVLREDLAEHERIMTATLARDADKACAFYRGHITLTIEKVASSIKA